MGHLRDSRFYKKKKMLEMPQRWRCTHLLWKADINVQKLRQVAKDGAVHTFCGKPMSMYRNCARWPKMAQSTEVGTAPWKKVFSPTRTDRARRS